MPAANDKNVTAADVIMEELAAIRQRRGDAKVYNFPVDPVGPLTGRDADEKQTRARLAALEEHTVGVAFSGGGIRSGTFAVGFLQGLAQLGLLRRIDYLSTVSGGGYAGGWLTAWLKREGDPVEVERQLHPSRVVQSEGDRALLGPSRVVDEEPEAIRHLRAYSSYLFPRFGALTADTWTVIAIWLRNVAINLTMLLPLAIMLVLAARMVVYGYQNVSPRWTTGDPVMKWVGIGLFGVGIVLFGLAFGYNATSLGEFRESGNDLSYRGGKPWKRRRAVASGVFHMLIYPLLAAVVLITISAQGMIGYIGRLVGGGLGGQRQTNNPLLNWLSDYIAGHLGFLGLPNFIGHALAFGLPMAGFALWINAKNGTLRPTLPGQPWHQQPWFAYPYAAFMAGAMSGALLPLLELLLAKLAVAQASSLAATIVPPLAIQIIVVGLMVEVALLGRIITEAEREWWSRLSAMLLIASIGWLLAMGTILYVPALFLSAGAPLRVAVTSGWLAATATAVLAGKSDGSKGLRGLSLGTIAAVGPPIFLVGILGLVALLVAYLVNQPALAFPGPGVEPGAAAIYVRGVAGTWFSTLLLWMVFTYVLFRVGSRHVDVNLFSLNAMYANRLTRCYLGASRPRPRWAPRWGFRHDPRSDAAAPALTTGGRAMPAPPPAADPAVPDAQLDAHIEDRKEAASKLRHRLDKLSRRRNPAPTAEEVAAARVELWTADWELLHLLDRKQALLPAGDHMERRWLDDLQSHLRAEVVHLATGLRSRDENPVTGFDPNDDVPLVALRQESESTERGRRYLGPIPLINTSLNLVAGAELALRDRKAESFVMTPYRCGSKSVGYAPVTLSSSENLTLGRAITISGAAVDPNMSFYQSAALTAFLAVFNARLGYWIQNPRYHGWDARGPKFGDRLIAELLGRTDNREEFVHLSDGGHFDNLGLYELVRRRCRYIIAVDAGEDANASDDNLAIVTRLCRIDFGVRIELDTAPLRETGEDRLSRTHVVMGRVHYEDVDSGQMPGVIVYIKISMTGDEPSDLQQYAKKDPRFPHHPTDLRQSFDEQMFECYRALGDHIARAVFKDAVGSLGDKAETRSIWEHPSNGNEYLRGNQLFFGAMRGQWASPPGLRDADFTESARAWVGLMRDIRANPHLAELSRDLYPELGDSRAAAAAAGDRAERSRQELHTVAQMLQIMEDAWSKLGFKGHYDLPMDRGWMNAFRRWSASRTFRRFWPTLRSEFGPDFVQFCEDQLHLGRSANPVYRLPDTYAPDDFEGQAVELLNAEYLREWPEAIAGAGQDLKAILTRAKALGASRRMPLPAWLIVQAPPGAQAARSSTEKFACGLVAFCECEDAELLRAEAARVVPGAAPLGVGGPVLELFAWVRRAHRSTGLGSLSYAAIRDEFIQNVPGATGNQTLHIVTRFPKSDSESNSDLELAMWKSFFALYDFRPVRLSRDRKQTILVREVAPVRADGRTNAARAESAS